MSDSEKGESGSSKSQKNIDDLQNHGNELIGNGGNLNEVENSDNEENESENDENQSENNDSNEDKGESINTNGCNNQNKESHGEIENIQDDKTSTLLGNDQNNESSHQSNAAGNVDEGSYQSNASGCHDNAEEEETIHPSNAAEIDDEASHQSDIHENDKDETGHQSNNDNTNGNNREKIKQRSSKIELDHQHEEEDNSKQINLEKNQKDKTNALIDNDSKTEINNDKQNVELSNVQNDNANALLNNENSENDGDEGIPLEPKLPPLKNLKTFNPSYSNDQTSKSARPVKNLHFAPMPRPVRPPRRNVQTAKYNDSTVFRRSWQINQPIEPTSEDQKLMQKAIQGEVLDNLELDVYTRLIILLQQLRKQLALQHKYKDCIKINEAVQRVEQWKLEKQKKSLQEDAENKFEQDKSNFESRKRSFNMETENELKNLEEKHKRQRMELLAEHERQENELMNKWMSPSKVRHYNKSSSTLTVLRKQRALLLTQNRFKEAETLQQEIEELTKQELQFNHILHQKDFEAAQTLLQEKQKEELEFFENKIAVEVAVFKQRRGRNRRAYENLERKMLARQEEIKEPDRLWNTTALQRNENNIGRNRSINPSSKIKKKDLGEADIAILPLPPLERKSMNRKK